MSQATSAIKLSSLMVQARYSTSESYEHADSDNASSSSASSRVFECTSEYTPPSSPESDTCHTARPLVLIESLPAHLPGLVANYLYKGTPAALADFSEAIAQGARLQKCHVDTDILCHLAIAVSQPLLAGRLSAVSVSDLQALHDEPDFRHQILARPRLVDASQAPHEQTLSTVEGAQVLLDMVSARVFGPGTAILPGLITTEIEYGAYCVHQPECGLQGRTVMGTAWLAIDIDDGSISPIATIAAVQAVMGSVITVHTNDIRQSIETDETQKTATQRSGSTRLATRFKSQRTRGRKHGASEVGIDISGTSIASDVVITKRLRSTSDRSTTTSSTPEAVYPRSSPFKRTANLVSLAQTASHEAQYIHQSATELLNNHPDKLDYNLLLRVALCYSNNDIFERLNADRLARGQKQLKSSTTIVKRIDRALVHLGKGIGIKSARSVVVGRRVMDPMRVVFDTLRKGNSGWDLESYEVSDTVWSALVGYEEAVIAAFQKLMPDGAQNAGEILRWAPSTTSDDVPGVAERCDSACGDLPPLKMADCSALFDFADDIDTDPIGTFMKSQGLETTLDEVSVTSILPPLPAADLEASFASTIVDTAPAAVTGEVDDVDDPTKSVLSSTEPYEVQDTNTTATSSAAYITGEARTLTVNNCPDMMRYFATSPVPDDVQVPWDLPSPIPKPVETSLDSALTHHVGFVWENAAFCTPVDLQSDFSSTEICVESMFDFGAYEAEWFNEGA